MHIYALPHLEFEPEAGRLLGKRGAFVIMSSQLKFIQYCCQYILLLFASSMNPVKFASVPMTLQPYSTSDQILCRS